jgi:hypothetical protein
MPRSGYPSDPRRGLNVAGFMTHPSRCPTRSLSSGPSVQKKASLGVLDNPGQPLLEVIARYCTTPKNIPPMGADFIKSQGLGAIGTSVFFLDQRMRGETNRQQLVASHASADVGLVCKHQQACP